MPAAWASPTKRFSASGPTSALSSANTVAVLQPQEDSPADSARACAGSHSHPGRTDAGRGPLRRRRTLAHRPSAPGNCPRAFRRSRIHGARAGGSRRPARRTPQGPRSARGRRKSSLAVCAGIVPANEVALHPHLFGMRRPHPERDAVSSDQGAQACQQSVRGGFGQGAFSTAYSSQGSLHRAPVG